MSLIELAEAIVAKNYREAMDLDPRYGDGDIAVWMESEWIKAAQAAIDGDDADLEFMLENNTLEPVFDRYDERWYDPHRLHSTGRSEW